MYMYMLQVLMSNLSRKAPNPRFGHQNRYIYPPPGLAPDGCVYRALDCQPAASCQYCQYCQYCNIIRGQQIGYLRLLASRCVSRFLMIF